MIYKSIFLPQFNYANIIWGNTYIYIIQIVSSYNNKDFKNNL